MPSGIANAKSPAAASLGVRTPQRQRGRDRVAALMASAAALFIEKGYEATTMTEIAARAGAAIGSLYLFFPTKAVLAQSMAMELAEVLSARLTALAAEVAGETAPAIGDALFGTLADFLQEHPVYAVLLDVPGDSGWRQAVRAKRRDQVAALFAQAEPQLPAAQAGVLAVLLPQLMRVGMQGAVLDELRAMLRHHLEAGHLETAATQQCG
jgi:AcrR family transcriptional regulator